ncbi:MAG TPA: hypothetical protein VKA67_09425 [Verrucomicrobiae bacterium]|nr:hypothetical protein [Verrucomicrobiae bacterium]
MKALFPISVIAGLLLVGCGNNSSSTSTQTTNASTSEGNPATAPADYVGAMGTAQSLAVKTADLSSIHEAIQMFQAEKSRFPKSLNELVQQKYLPRLPQPPHGMKFVYNPSTGQVNVAPQ